MIERLFGVLLYLLPTEVRAEYGAEMRETFRRRLLAADGRPVALLRLCLRETSAMLRAARRVRRPTRGRRGVPVANVQGLLVDLRQASRALIRAPAFAATVTLILALGIGTSTAIFTLLNGIVLRDLPYPEPGRLARVFSGWPARAQPLGNLSQPDIVELNSAASVEAVAGYTQSAFDVVYQPDTGPAEQMRVTYHTSAFFQVLGRQPLLGTLPDPDRLRADPRVVMLSHEFWRGRLGSDPEIVGRLLTIEGQPLRVVGVMPDDFHSPHRGTAAWAPVALRGSWVAGRQFRFLLGIARVAREETLTAAQEQLSSLATAMERQYPDTNQGLSRVELVPLREVIVGTSSRATLWFATGTALTLLLIACANVANLALARGRTRARELGIRAALGARRVQIVRTLLAESTMIGVNGAFLGICLAWVLVPVLVAQSPESLPRLEELRPDAGTLLGATVLSMATLLLTGLLPAVELSRQRSFGSRFAARNLGAGRRDGPAHGLVSLQLAATVIVLAAAALFVRSMMELGRVDPGFSDEGVVVVRARVAPEHSASLDSLRSFHHRTLERLNGLPGVMRASLISSPPFGNVIERIPFSVPSATELSSGDSQAVYQMVSAETFEVLQVPVLAGRSFTIDDGPDDPPVVVIGDSVRRQFFGEATGIGENLRVAGELLTVVGVAGDVKHTALDADAPATLYRPYDQGNPWGVSYLVKVEVDPLVVMPAIRQLFLDIDPGQPLQAMEPLDGMVEATLGERRFFTRMLSTFSLFAMLLAATGVYGVIAHQMSNRRRELALRLALGGSESAVRRLALRTGMRPAAAGILAGTLAALVLSRFATGLVFGIESTDPVTFASTIAILLGLSYAAAAIPARRVSAVNPMAVLRGE